MIYIYDKLHMLYMFIFVPMICLFVTCTYYETVLIGLVHPYISWHKHSQPSYSFY